MYAKKILVGIAFLIGLQSNSYAVHHKPSMAPQIGLAIIAASLGLIGHGCFNLPEAKRRLEWWERKLIPDFEERMAYAEAYATAYNRYASFDTTYYVSQPFFYLNNCQTFDDAHKLLNLFEYRQRLVAEILAGMIGLGIFAFFQWL